MSATCSFSTRRRTCSTVFGGLYASSSVIRLIFRPFTPPCSLTIRKYAASTFEITPYAEAGPLSGPVCPTLISVSETPGA